MQISEWSPNASIDHAAFFASILRFQTILPGFKVDMSACFPRVIVSAPSFNYALSSYLASLSTLPSAFAFVSSLSAQTSPSASLSSILQSAILPKVAASLHAFVIDPSNQTQLSVFTDALAWHAFIDADALSAALEAAFFPQWLQVLYHWIHSSGSLAEILQWLRGWQSLFPSDLLRNRYVQRQWNRAWDIVNEVVAKGPSVDVTRIREKSVRVVLQERAIELRESTIKEVGEEKGSET